MPGDARHAFVIVADRADDARDGGAVRLVILRAGQIVQEVVTLVEHQIGLQIRMIQVDPGIQHRHQHVGGTWPQIPGLLHADATQVPLERAIERIVGHDPGLLFAFNFGGAHHVVVSAQRRQRGVCLVGQPGDSVDAQRLDGLDDPTAHRGDELLRGRATGARSERNQRQRVGR